MIHTSSGILGRRERLLLLDHQDRLRGCFILFQELQHPLNLTVRIPLFVGQDTILDLFEVIGHGFLDLLTN